ncbi:jg11739 [Pararge aegeria aegeria]|uniref:Jg11739 protein n=1 Tax=Pararge aegeria aegeria TaxID=348720 RepID=A0A8S4SQJ5_9NEOP|nr:jg11739 [Pararge aegeria aegeria]
MQSNPRKKSLGCLMFDDGPSRSSASVRVAQIWFKRFQSGNFDVKDAPHSGHPIMDKMDAIFEVEQDRHISSYNVAEELGIDHKTVLAHLKKTVHKKAGYLGTSRAH